MARLSKYQRSDLEVRKITHRPINHRNKWTCLGSDSLMPFQVDFPDSAGGKSWVFWMGNSTSTNITHLLRPLPIFTAKALSKTSLGINGMQWSSPAIIPAVTMADPDTKPGPNLVEVGTQTLDNFTNLGERSTINVPEQEEANTGSEVEQQTALSQDKMAAEVKSKAATQMSEMITIADQRAKIIRNKATQKAEYIKKKSNEKAEKLVAQADQEAEKVKIKGKNAAVADQRAKKIRNKATQKAEKIINKANEKAEKLVAQADQEAEKVQIKAKKAAAAEVAAKAAQKTKKGALKATEKVPNRSAKKAAKNALKKAKEEKKKATRDAKQKDKEMKQGAKLEKEYAERPASLEELQIVHDANDAQEYAVHKQKHAEFIAKNSLSEIAKADMATTMARRVRREAEANCIVQIEKTHEADNGYDFAVRQTKRYRKQLNDYKDEVAEQKANDTALQEKADRAHSDAIEELRKELEEVKVQVAAQTLLADEAAKGEEMLLKKGTTLKTILEDKDKSQAQRKASRTQAQRSYKKKLHE